MGRCRTVFDAHLKCLRNFWEATKKHELLDKICTKLYNIGWYVIMLKPSLDRPSNFCLSIHSGALPITPVIMAAVSASAFAAALKDTRRTLRLTLMERMASKLLQVWLLCIVYPPIWQWSDLFKPNSIYLYGHHSCLLKVSSLNSLASARSILYNDEFLATTTE
jgi:hypothetical protein